jgi:hypothetical protein
MVLHPTNATPSIFKALENDSLFQSPHSLYSTAVSQRNATLRNSLQSRCTSQSV